jgi:hypothetical protein
MRAYNDITWRVACPLGISMSNSLTSRRESKKSTDSPQKTSQDTDTQRVVTGFVRAELDLAFTMLGIARETGQAADRERFLNVAPNSISSVRAFEGRIIDAGDALWARARVRILESAFKELKLNHTRLRNGGVRGASV